MTKASLRNAGPFESVLPSKKALSCAAGETIFTQGDDCEDIHYIERGVVKLTLVSSRGRDAVLGILGSGDFMGEGCLAGATAYATSAVAIAPSTLHAVGRKAMAALLARQQRIEQDLADPLLSPSEKRLARMLLLLAQYSKEDQVPHILEKIMQDTLAEMVGTTRSRVNFFVNKFRRMGSIQYNGRLKVNQSLQNVLHD